MNTISKVSLAAASAILSVGAAMAAGTLPASEAGALNPDRLNMAARLNATKTMAPDDNLAPRLGTEMSSVLPASNLAEKLTTVQGILPNSFYYQSLSGVNFQPKGSSTTISYAGAGCISVAGVGEVIAQLQLPDGATIKFVRMFYDRNNVGQTSSMTVWKFFPAGGTIPDYFDFNATLTGQNSDLSTEQSMVVDNYSYTYQADWLASTASNNQLCGVRVAYYMPPTGTYSPLTPCRLIDTRSANPPNLTPSPRSFQVSGHCYVPTGATAVTANITTDQTTNSTAMAIYPSGTSWPGNSNLNWSAGQIVANSAVLTLGNDGKINAFIGVGSAALILDITGYYY
jgi:hypothetical protein